MKSTIGRPRKLSDAQVTTILQWHEAILAWNALRKGIPTQRALAKALGVSSSAVSHVVACRGHFKGSSQENRHAELTRRRRRLDRLRARGFL
jgi:hypothetical protein